MVRQKHLDIDSYKSHGPGSVDTEGTDCVEQQCAHYGLGYPNQIKHPYSNLM